MYPKPRIALVDCYRDELIFQPIMYIMTLHTTPTWIAG